MPTYEFTAFVEADLLEGKFDFDVKVEGKSIHTTGHEDEIDFYSWTWGHTANQIEPSARSDAEVAGKGFSDAFGDVAGTSPTDTFDLLF